MNSDDLMRRDGQCDNPAPEYVDVRVREWEKRDNKKKSPKPISDRDALAVDYY